MHSIKKFICRWVGHKPNPKHMPIGYANKNPYFDRQPIIEYLYVEVCTRCDERLI